MIGSYGMREQISEIGYGNQDGEVLQGLRSFNKFSMESTLLPLHITTKKSLTYSH